MSRTSVKSRRVSTFPTRISTWGRPSRSARAIWRATLGSTKRASWPGPIWLKARTRNAGRP